jgi:plasmid stabilization system protein ParE
VAEYRLTPRAQRDLAEVFDYIVASWEHLKVCDTDSGKLNR